MDSPAASRLGANRAIVFSEERGSFEKFRPYGPPGNAWRDWFLGKEPAPMKAATPKPEMESAAAETLDISEFRIS